MQGRCTSIITWKNETLLSDLQSLSKLLHTENSENWIVELSKMDISNCIYHPSSPPKKEKKKKKIGEEKSSIFLWAAQTKVNLWAQNIGLK